MRNFIALWAFCLAFSIGPAYGFSEGGHHLIAVLAFEQLPEERQQELLKILSHHPQFEKEFRVPEKVKDEEQWLIGRAGYWADVARRYPEFNRSTWRYQLGASDVLGDVEPHEAPGPLPDDATTRHARALRRPSYRVVQTYIG